MLTRASSTGGAHKLELGGCMLLWNSLHRYQFSKLPALSQVPRIVNPPADVFKRYFVAQAAPIVLIGSPHFSGQPRSLDDILRKDVGKIHVKVRGGDYVNVRTRQQERLTLSEYIERYVRPWEYDGRDIADTRSEEHTSELQSLMRISYAVFCLKK